MIDENGLIHTNLKDVEADLTIPAGKDSLSESVGLWMTYTILKRDQELFNEINETLQDYFLTEESVIVWKVENEGEKKVKANALIDDLRILGVLLQAGELFDQSKYKKQALKLGETIVRKNQYKGYLTDFYDLNTNTCSNRITLSYIDLTTLKKLHDYGIVSKTLLVNMTELIETLPSGNIFYPFYYSIDEQKYFYADEVHMIDQVYIAYHLARQGKVKNSFLAFIKSEIEKGQLFGRYDSVTFEPTVEYESPALYGLAVLYSLEAGEPDLALRLYTRMKHFMINDLDHRYKGGYIDLLNSDTHIFDNLLPLIAERVILNEELVIH